MDSFHGATLTKVMLGVVGVGIIASPSSPTWLSSTELRSADVMQGQIWRLVSCQAAPMTMFRGMAALALMYRLVNVERVLGTSRFSALLLVATIVAGVAVVSASASTGGALDGAEPGPLAVLGAMAGVFGAVMRPSTRAEQLRIGGVPVTDKTVTMALAAWVLLGGGFRSAVPALAGFGVGALFASGSLPLLSGIRMPAFLSSACGATIGRILGSPPPGHIEAARRRAAAVRRLGAQPGMRAGAAADAVPGMMRAAADARRRHGGAGRAGPADAAAPMGGAAGGAATGDGDDGGGAAAFAGLPRVDPDPAKVAQLVEMGFSEEQAEGALRRSMNNLEHAAASLLQ